jgi:Mg-chelatase subunit ChlD
MKSRIIAAALFAATAATVVLFPYARSTGASGNPPASIVKHIVPQQASKPRVEVVFVLDTTASMGGLIQAAKEKIWSIASTMASASQAPEVHMGLVAFRDRGDAYVTRVVDLSPDLDSMYATLMDFRAAGGGDGPESVNQALHDAVHRISWSQDENTYRVVFLVGDAPPHMDYGDDVPYAETVRVPVRQHARHAQALADHRAAR